MEPPNVDVNDLDDHGVAPLVENTVGVGSRFAKTVLTYICFVNINHMIWFGGLKKNTTRQPHSSRHYQPPKNEDKLVEVVHSDVRCESQKSHIGKSIDRNSKIDQNTNRQ